MRKTLCSAHLVLSHARTTDPPTILPSLASQLATEADDHLTAVLVFQHLHCEELQACDATVNVGGTSTLLFRAGQLRCIGLSGGIQGDVRESDASDLKAGPTPSGRPSVHRDDVTNVRILGKEAQSGVEKILGLMQTLANDEVNFQ